MRLTKSGAFAALSLYGFFLGASLCDADQQADSAAAVTNVTRASVDTSAKADSNAMPAPGSEGDTLTVEDARMAYLVYKLLNKDGSIKGADIKRGEKLFFQNCRPCHGEDGRRVDFNPGGMPEYIGIRARNDAPTFWYQMNFGDEDRNMEAYIDEIDIDEMRDIIGYAQTLP